MRVAHVYHHGDMHYLAAIPNEGVKLTSDEVDITEGTTQLSAGNNSTETNETMNDAGSADEETNTENQDNTTDNAEEMIVAMGAMQIGEYHGEIDQTAPRGTEQSEEVPAPNTSDIKGHDDGGSNITEDDAEIKEHISATDEPEDHTTDKGRWTSTKNPTVHLVHQQDHTVDTER